MITSNDKNQTRFQTCAHEAGHAVIGHAAGFEVALVEVFGDGFDYGHCIFTNNSFVKPTNFHDAEPQIIMSMAGRIATDKAALTRWTIAKPPPNLSHKAKAKDFPKPRITLAAAHIEKIQAGESETDIHTEQRLAASFFPREVVAPWLYYLLTRARLEVNKHWPQIMAVASRLFYKSQIWTAEFKRIMEGEKCAQ